MSELVPLFPLKTVLLPGGQLDLRIFEPRYVDMVRECTRTSRPFGVVLISAGREAGIAAQSHDVGTLARIVDFRALPDGLLGITAVGTERFRVESRSVRSNQLIVADVALLPEAGARTMPPEFAALAQLLRRILTLPEVAGSDAGVDFDDPSVVSGRLASLLPFTAQARQQLLLLDSAVERLAAIERLLRVDS